MLTGQANMSPDDMVVVDGDNRRYGERGGYGTHFNYDAPENDPFPPDLLHQLTNVDELDDLPVGNVN